MQIKNKRKEFKMDDLLELIEVNFVDWLKSSGIAFSIAGALLILAFLAHCVDKKSVLGAFALVWLALFCYYALKVFIVAIVTWYGEMDEK